MIRAVTCYFDSAGDTRRLANYRRFRERLKIPLTTVALGRTGLRDGDADHLIRLPAGDALWQKERLLDIAVRSLPAECTKVAWLDCDVLFADQDWSLRASDLLERVPLAQLFRNVRYLDGEGRVERTRPSLASGVAAGLAPDVCLAHPSPQQRPGTYACGLAWAARRDVLDRHGLFDGNVIGGGDRAIACAAYGCFEHEAEWHCLNEKQRRFYLEWAVPFHAAIGGSVSFLDVDLDHLWHGGVTQRRLGSRHAGFAEFAFDPYADIARDEHGSWRWSSDKPRMHAYVRDYFAARAEA